MHGPGWPSPHEPSFHPHGYHQSHPAPRPDTRSNYFNSNDARFPVSDAYNAPHSHPTYTQDFEVPLDAFDKELLAQIPSDRQHEAAQGRARISLPPRYGEFAGTEPHDRAIRNDLQEAATLMGSSSPSPYGIVSSPTISALQNRRVPQSRVIARPMHHTAPTSPARVDAMPVEYEHRAPASAQHDQPPAVQGIQLVCTEDMPDKIRSIFPYEVLNAVQSKCFHTAFKTDDNLILSAPTGSGKTIVMELAIARLLSTSQSNDFKVVYMAPIKALCFERQQDWQRKFSIHGLECAELTGDTDYNQLRKVQQANIIITTPEKWDSVTRKWKDNAKLVQLIKLFLVDEVHILKDSRGATLEAVVSRMKSMQTPIRFVALSATVPNSEDIALWLGKDSMSPHLPAQREVFDESFRPVKLEKHVYGFQGGSNDFQFDVKLRNQVPNIIRRHSKGKPTMIFCMTRKSAAQTATALASLWGQSPSREKPWKAPSRSANVKDNDLRPLLAAGVAFHHAGVNQDDRQAVEQGFINGSINVICSTSTLAVGVNLPCYMVILQGTMSYGDAGPQEYSDLEVMQMLGRAGRPQYERSACAAILTRENKVDRYRKIVSGQDLLESTLHRNLIEHLNAEIGLGTVSDVESAKRWLASTFLNVRLQKNPAFYQLGAADSSNGEAEILQRICEKDIDLLSGAELIKTDKGLKCTELGDAMARYYVKFETMKTFAAIPPKAKMSEIFSILSQASEFVEVRFRAGEKSFYKELNKANEIRYPFKIDIAQASQKVSLILQAHLGSVHEPSGPEFNKHLSQYHTDTFIIFSHANRLIRCIIDCQLYLKDATSARNALELARSLAAKAWDNTPNVLKQIQGIGDVSMRKLAAKGINSMDTLSAAEPQRIDLLLGKQQPYGHNLLKRLSTLPTLRVSIKEMGRKIQNGIGVFLNLKCEVGFLNETAPTRFQGTFIYVCFLLEDSNGTMIDFRRFSATKLKTGEDILLTANLTQPTTHIRAHVMCDEIAGTSKYAELQIHHIAHTVYPKPIKAALGRDYTTTDKSADEKSLGRDSCNAFEDDGVDDKELLAAANPVDTIEVIQDIDDLMQEEQRSESSKQQSKKSNQSTQRSSIETDDDDDQPGFTEPTQLDNGRWKCQHLCKEKGIDCKHKCCLQGVPKPKRRPKNAAKLKDGDTKHKTLTSMNTVNKTASATSSLKPKTASLDDLRWSVTQNRQTDQLGSALPSENTSKKRKLSSVEDVGDQEAHFKGDYTRDGPPNAFDADWGLDSLDTDMDIDAELWEPKDCDWNLPPSHQADTSLSRLPDYASPADGKLRGADVEGVDGNVSGLSPERPVHVSMADVQMKPDKAFFLTGQSSSPLQSAQPKAGRRVESSSEGFFGTPLDADDFDSGISTGADTQAQSNMSERSVAQNASRQHPAQETTSKTEEVEQLNEDETDDEKEKRLWKEDQMRRWSQLEPWMYEMFGSFTEIVD